MSLELQARVLELLEAATRRRVYAGPTPDWLQRPGRRECGRRWRLVTEIYAAITDGLELPDQMRPRESRTIDAVIGGSGRPRQLVEIDEKQHFNVYRSATLALYPQRTRLGFPKRAWIERGEDRTPGIGGGWGKPKPPLFPMPGGRHRQRAFRDALADLLPDLHGYGPTIRISHFEVELWIWDRGATARLARLVEDRISPA